LHSRRAKAICDNAPKASWLSKPQRPSTISARLARVEENIVHLAGSTDAVPGTSARLGAWMEDVKQRLERMELLLFSCNFEQFNQIDDMIKTLRKEHETVDMVLSDCSHAVDDLELQSNSSACSAASGCGEHACISTGFLAAGSSCPRLQESAWSDGDVFGTALLAADPEEEFWGKRVSCEDGLSASFGASFNDHAINALDEQSCMATKTIGSADTSLRREVIGLDPCRVELEQCGFSCFSSERWNRATDPGQELSFDELIASRAPGQVETALIGLPSATSCNVVSAVTDMG